MISKIQTYVISTEVAIKFMTQMLVSIPAKLHVIHTNSWIPMSSVILFFTPAFKNFHSSPSGINIKISFENDIKNNRIVWWQIRWKIEIHNCIINNWLNGSVVNIKAFNYCSQAFFLIVSGRNIVDILHISSFNKGITIEMKIHFC